MFNFSLGQNAGVLDSSFHSIGYKVTSINNVDDRAVKTILQPDGKILVAGASMDSSGIRNFMVMRLNTDGSFDNTFNQNGIVITPVNSGNAIIRDMALQPDGKIVAVGESNNGTDNDFTTVRYNSNGTLDSSFATNGVQITNIMNQDYPNAMVISDSGNIIVAGGSDFGINKMTLVQYNSMGILDTNFGIYDNLSVNPGEFYNIYDMQLQADGKILLGGAKYSYVVFNDNLSLARLLPNGLPDSTFGLNSVVELNTGDYESVNAIAIQPDGKIVAVGDSDLGLGLSYRSFVLVRFLTNGSVDSTFNSSGIVTNSISGIRDIAYDVQIQSGGKIIVVGVSDETIYGGDFTIVRYHSNGTIDTSFGTNGIVSTKFSTNHARAMSAVIQTNDKLIVTGYCLVGPTWNIVTARYHLGFNVGIIDNQMQNINLFIYPNPVTDWVNVSYSLTKRCQVDIALLDINGRYINTPLFSTYREKGHNTESFNVRSSLPKGYYLLKLSACKSEKYIKLLKQ